MTKKEIIMSSVKLYGEVCIAIHKLEICPSMSKNQINSYIDALKQERETQRKLLQFIEEIIDI
jgi:hypothetical protein